MDDDQACFQKLLEEREEMVYRALETLAKGQGGEKEIAIIANEIGIPNPCKGGKHEMV